jgi:hypothetical protein
MAPCPAEIPKKRTQNPKPQMFCQFLVAASSAIICNPDLSCCCLNPLLLLANAKHHCLLNTICFPSFLLQTIIYSPELSAYSNPT